ncbi:ion channel [Heyndrickxia ginsengihumi]|uniref:Transporter n=1 Tax=Heyndrickxia ginsengihumi TaxID=363870 RepID=A0A0A6VAI0_9BACI|nr:ion channel [Heyndrickxia ginsengihumi]KHD85240.1 transporter [Heyndrickxia ginsengihumi]MBE6184189.1 two pore domain potassium channel family protein [Bacillus sp. (in: firmicutes)]MCM3024481.1 ion channel [Heyndrickxia ginsengihumi]NEY20204.1 two pore domain potassium channel family protein [Heyndrickxia ginsengihumi]
MFIIFGILVVICIVMSLKTLFFTSKLKYRQVSFDNFLFLSFTYTNIMIGFGLLYMILDIIGFPIALDHGHVLTGHYIERLLTYMYLSAVTLFSVGFGDVVPIGIARLLAVIESLLGYTIPATFMVKSLLDTGKK